MRILPLLFLLASTATAQVSNPSKVTASIPGEGLVELSAGCVETAGGCVEVYSAGGGGGGGTPVLDAMTEWWDLQSCSGEFDDGEIAGVDLVFGSTTGADSNDPTCGADGLTFDAASDEYAEAASGQPATGADPWTVFVVINFDTLIGDATLASWGLNADDSLVSLHNRGGDARLDVRTTAYSLGNSGLFASAGVDIRLIMVYDGSEIEFWIDGVLGAGDTMFNGALTTGAGTPFRIGAGIRSEQYPLAGSVRLAGYDDVALDAAAVADLDAELATLLP